MQYLNQILDILLPSIASIITVVFGILGAKLKAKYDEKIDNETKRKVVESTVAYVQQVYNTLKGEEKLDKAMTTASELLISKGITITDLELRMLIESAVYGLKQGSGVLEIPEAKEETVNE